MRNHCKKPTQEKSPTENIIHVGTNNTSRNKEPKNIANDQLRMMQTEQLSLMFYQRKFNSKAKDVNTHLQVICFRNNLILIISLQPTAH